jgi:hypothetical protein
MSARWPLRCLLISIAASLLAACSNGTGSVEERQSSPPSTPPSTPPPSAPPAEVSSIISATVTGLAGQGLVLQNNGADDIAVSANGTYSFSISIPSGAAYNVTVRTQPSNPAQTCNVINGSGTASGSNVNVAVSCASLPTHSVGGRVSGLRGIGLVLQNNARDDLPIQSDGEFTFPTRLESGATYNVSILTQPTAPLQSCTVANGTGTITGDIRNVQVTCATAAFRVRVNVTGLLGNGLRLRNNGGGAPLDIPRDGAYEFAQRVANGSTYNVTVERQPSNPTQSCVASNGSGTMGSQDVTVNMTCTTSTFSIRGTVNNLVGTGLVLRNGGTQLSVNTSSFEFPDVPSGSTYNIQVATQPTSPVQSCTVSNGTGVVGAGNIENVRVDCVTTEFTIGGEVEGYVGSGLRLLNNGADNLAIAANGPFTFADSLPQGTPYSVSVAAQPVNPAQECAVANGAGTVGTSNVTSVRVSCTTVEFTVGGNVTGLSNGQSSGVFLQNNGTDTIEVISDGAFTFPVRIRTGQPYNVTVLTHPTNPTRLCSVVNSAGIMGSAPVTNVQVFCIGLPFFP